MGGFLGHLRVRSDGASAAGEAGSGAAAWGVEPASRASRPSPRERCRARQTRKGSPARRQEQEDAAVGGDDGGRTEERLHAHARFEAARLGVVRAAVGSEPVHAVVGQSGAGVPVARAHRCGTTNSNADAKARARPGHFRRHRRRSRRGERASAGVSPLRRPPGRGETREGGERGGGRVEIRRHATRGRRGRGGRGRGDAKAPTQRGAHGGSHDASFE